MIQNPYERIAELESEVERLKKDVEFTCEFYEQDIVVLRSKLKEHTDREDSYKKLLNDQGDMVLSYIDRAEAAEAKADEYRKRAERAEKFMHYSGERLEKVLCEDFNGGAFVVYQSNRLLVEDIIQKLKVVGGG